MANFTDPSSDVSSLTSLGSPEEQAKYLSNKYGNSIDIQMDENGAVHASNKKGDIFEIPAPKKSLMDTVFSSIGQAAQPLPGVGTEEANEVGKKALNYAPAIASTALALSSEGASTIPQFLAQMALQGGVQGATKAAVNKIQGNPALQNVGTESAIGASGPMLGGIFGKLAKAMVPAEEATAPTAAKALADALEKSNTTVTKTGTKILPKLLGGVQLGNEAATTVPSFVPPVVQEEIRKIAEGIRAPGSLTKEELGKDLYNSLPIYKQRMADEIQALANQSPKAVQESILLQRATGGNNFVTDAAKLLQQGNEVAPKAIGAPGTTAALLLKALGSGLVNNGLTGTQGTAQTR
jgi:hypothetical protein